LCALVGEQQPRTMPLCCNQPHDSFATDGDSVALSEPPVEEERGMWTLDRLTTLNESSILPVTSEAVLIDRVHSCMPQAKNRGTRRFHTGDENQPPPDANVDRREAMRMATKSAELREKIAKDLLQSGIPLSAPLAAAANAAHGRCAAPAGHGLLMSLSLGVASPPVATVVHKHGTAAAGTSAPCSASFQHLPQHHKSFSLSVSSVEAGRSHSPGVNNSPRAFSMQEPKVTRRVSYAGHEESATLAAQAHAALKPTSQSIFGRSSPLNSPRNSSHTTNKAVAGRASPLNSPRNSSHTTALPKSQSSFQFSDSRSQSFASTANQDVSNPGLASPAPPMTRTLSRAPKKESFSKATKINRSPQGHHKPVSRPASWLPPTEAALSRDRQQPERPRSYAPEKTNSFDSTGLSESTLVAIAEMIRNPSHDEAGVSRSASFLNDDFFKPPMLHPQTKFQDPTYVGRFPKRTRSCDVFWKPPPEAKRAIEEVAPVAVHLTPREDSLNGLPVTCTSYLLGQQPQVPQAAQVRRAHMIRSDSMQAVQAHRSFAMTPRQRYH